VPDIVLDDSARLLVVLHALAAIVLIGSTTHHWLISVGYLRGSHKVRLARIYALVGLCAYGVTFGLGLLAYPTFRYHVRGLYLDRHAPWASNLFDMKENFAALGLPLVIATFVLSRILQPKDDRALIYGYVALVTLTALIVWFSVVGGIVVTMTRGV
jgi:hypothetical protein